MLLNYSSTTYNFNELLVFNRGNYANRASPQHVFVSFYNFSAAAVNLRRRVDDINSNLRMELHETRILLFDLQRRRRRSTNSSRELNALAS